ncbi:MAG: YIP1 family protein [Acidobacteria bacterium]|jgi:hypothetical protein|nr:YIP1 family protein [Acidobacteriota bacterium]
MDFNAIIKRVIGIITKPNEEWVVIKENSLMTIGDMFTNYAVILAAIPAIAGFIGNAMVGRTVMGFSYRVPIANSLIWAILTYALSLVGLFIAAFVIDALATTFGSEKNMVSSMKVAVFANTPIWIAGVLHIIPALSVLVIIAGLYSLYLLYLGIKIVKNPPADKAMGYFIVVLIVDIVIFFLMGFITAAVAFGSAAGYMRY